MLGFALTPAQDMTRGRPPLGFDFTRKTLQPGVTVTRASGGSFVSADGVVRMAGANVPRLTHVWRGGGLQPGGLLVEPERTNLSPWSSDTSNPGWTGTGVTRTTGQPDPFGGAGAVLVTGNGELRSHYDAGPSVTYTAGSVYTQSRFVRPLNGLNFLQFVATSTAFGVVPFANFRFSDPAVTASAGILGAGVERVNMDWYRVWMSIGASASGAAPNGTVLALITRADAPRLEESSSTSQYLTTGAQVELAATPSSYVPSVGGPAVRNADSTSLLWQSRGVADGSRIARFLLADGTTDAQTITVAGGVAAVPSNLVPAKLARAEVPG